MTMNLFGLRESGREDALGGSATTGNIVEEPAYVSVLRTAGPPVNATLLGAH
jgi:hypothetical protein